MDDFLPLFQIFPVASVQIDRQLLIKLCYLFSQIPGTGMDNQIFGSVRGLINFYEMVAAPKGS